MRTAVIALGLPPLLLVLVGSFPARAAGLFPVAQSRSVDVAIDATTSLWTTGLPPSPPDLTSTESSSDAHASPDFAPFSAAAAVPGFDDTAAMQTSRITGRSITASGSQAGFADGEDFTSDDPPGYGIDGETLDLGSSFSVTFTLQEATDYTLSGSVGFEGGFVTSSRAHVRLLGPGSAVIHEAEVESDAGCVDPECLAGGDAIDVAGTLAAGTYTLEAQTIGTATWFFSTALGGPVGLPTSGSYDVAFELAQSVPASSGAGRALLWLFLVELASLRLWRRPH